MRKIDPFCTPATQKKKYSTKDRLEMIMNIHLVSECELTANGFPVVKPFNGFLPPKFVGFNYVNSKTSHSCGIHFYVDDYQFERLWRSPELYLNTLARFRCMISTDFSIYVDMPHPMKVWNVFRNRFFAAWWQARGLEVIPNVSWADPGSFDYCFDGLPQRSVIAVNSMGANRHHLTKYLWLKGFEEVLGRLDPCLVLRYGERVDGEDDSRSLFINNPIIERLHHGR